MKSFCSFALGAWVTGLCVAAPLPPSSGSEDITPRVGIVEVYGVHKVSPEKIKSAIGAKPGAFLRSRIDSEEKLNKISGVVASRVQAVCCDGRGTILYIGVEEKNAPHIEFRPSPAGTATLPADLTEKYEALIASTAESLRARNADEDLTNGYSLMADPESRELQQSLIPLVAKNIAIIDQVLHEASDPDQRATAAYILQYGPRDPRTSKTISNDLQYALQDRDEDVRKNAMLALKAVMAGAHLHPNPDIRIEPTWFVELLNSVVWSDRHNASLALVTLTENRDPDTLALIRERALSSVLEMAKWQDLEHALPAFVLAGRLSGMDEKEIQAAWVSGDREPVLKRALKPNNKRSAVTALNRVLDARN